MCYMCMCVCVCVCDMYFLWSSLDRMFEMRREEEFEGTEGEGKGKKSC